MLSTLAIVLPIFALIFAGWTARRIGVLGAQATSELNRFVIYLALPALLFDITTHARWADVWQPGFVASFGLSAGLIFVATVLLRRKGARPLADAAIDGLNAGYANVGFIGFPLTLVAIGRAALAPTLIAMIITVCFLFAAAVVLIEVGLQGEARQGRVALKVGGSLLRNPLITAPMLGALLPLAGLQVPGAVESFLKMLGGAASPCALVALGLFLAAERTRNTRPVFRSAALLVGCKLFVQPAVAWIFATLVFRLSPLLAHSAVLLAALPTGTGPFMLAEFYQREAAVTSSVVLASTVASVLTISLYFVLAV